MERPLIDPNFEPRSRVRSNTWPLRPKVEPGTEELTQPPAVVAEEVVDSTSRDVIAQNLANTAAAKKGNSRRNAWGNLSYADLITQAIQSSPEGRLTLSQIYDWMVQNVPYFKDKGDSNSSAGWKNSIRHNLSLHSRFMRTQNEGAGKSSWWVINPDAKSGKSPRRRAYSMDTKDKAMERKRGRAKKKVEALRANDGLGSPNSTISENLELLTEPNVQALQLSPEFRPRTSSNASSCGRISPLRPQLLQDCDDGMSPISWNRGSSSSLNAVSFQKDNYSEMLNISEMMTLTLADSSVADSGFDDGLSGPFGFPQQPQQQQQQQFNLAGQYSSQLPPPPPYQERSPLGQQQQQQQQQQQNLMMVALNTQSMSISPEQLSPQHPQQQVNVSSGGQMHQLFDDDLQSSLYTTSNCTVSSNGGNGLFGQEFISNRGLMGQMNGQIMNATSADRNSILRAALTKPQAPTLAALLTSPDPGTNGINGMPMESGTAACPRDLYELGTLSDFPDFGCDVNEVINHELNVEGCLDCTFDSIGTNLGNDF